MGCFRFIRMGRACAGDDLYRASGVEYRFAAGTFGVLSNFQAIQISAASGKAALANVERFPFTGLAAMTATILGAAQTLYAVSAIALLLVALVPPIIVNKA